VATSLARAPIGIDLRVIGAVGPTALTRRLSELGLRVGSHVRCVQKTAGGGRIIDVAGSRWVHPERLVVLTGMSRERCDEWLRACAARGLATPAARRAILMRHAEITASGLARLARWNAELTTRAALAQPWTASTAPTSPEVSSPRSWSDVT
jgi:ferrous iron transport protein A